MNEASPPESLGQQAAARAAAAVARANAAEGLNPAPGDVFVFRENAEHPVQWVVLARDPSRLGKLLVAIADANPLLGTHDLEIGDDALGPLVLRRPHGGWLDADHFDLDLKVGTLRLDRLSRARDHWFSDTGSALVAAEEVDEDPEYRHWIETALEPAWAAVFKTAARPAPEPKPRWPAIAAAATILIALGGTSLWFHQQKVQKLLADKAQAEQLLTGQIEELKVTQQEAAARLREEVEEQKRWVEDYEDKLSQAANDPGLRNILSDLRTRTQEALRSVSVINPAVKIIGLARTRGRVVVELPPDATHAVLLLKVEDDQDGARYRLDLHYANEPEVLFTLSGLEVHSLGEIKVGIPTAVLKPGYPYDVRLVLEGMPRSEGGLYEIAVH